MISYSTISEKGGRPVNEDSFSVAKRGESFCFTLCDGLGGHGSGDIASKGVAKLFKAVFEQSKLNGKKFFDFAYSKSNEAVIEYQEKKGNTYGTKTTVVSLIVDSETCMWSHLGDSRLYCFKKDSDYLRTLDHSVPQMLVRSKEISETEIRFHPDRNKILRAIGVDDEKPNYQLSECIKTNECSAFLLCSDGFWELIDEIHMISLLKASNSPDEWLKKMSEIVLSNGKGKNMDNYTAIAVFVG